MDNDEFRGCVTVIGRYCTTAVVLDKRDNWMIQTADEGVEIYSLADRRVHLTLRCGKRRKAALIHSLALALARRTPSPHDTISIDSL